MITFHETIRGDSESVYKGVFERGFLLVEDFEAPNPASTSGVEARALLDQSKIDTKPPVHLHKELPLIVQKR